MASRRSVFYLALLAVPLVLTACNGPSPSAPAPSWSAEYAEQMRLWYDEPASEWVEGLPVGNGRLGAMVFGRTGTERIQINEESVWTGHRMNDNNPEARENLADIRQLIFEGQNTEAFEEATDHLLATPPTLRSYQTLMDLTLDGPGGDTTTAYDRSLDLETGIATTTYTHEGVRHTREVFASAPDDAIVVRWTAEEPGMITTDVALSRSQDATVRAPSDSELLLNGQIEYESNADQAAGAR
jgi:alpha-L-fucosidase 2